MSMGQTHPFYDNISAIGALRKTNERISFSGENGGRYCLESLIAYVPGTPNTPYFDQGNRVVLYFNRDIMAHQEETLSAFKRAPRNPLLRSLSFSILLSIAAAGFLALVGVYIHHYASGNDLWDNHYLAMAMNFSDVKSLYDGFFPIGYSLILKALAGEHFPVYAAFYINVVLALCLFMTVAWYLRRTTTNPPAGGASKFPEGWNLGGEFGQLGFLFPLWLVLFLLYPRSFRYLITPGPDMAASALFTIGMVIQLARFKGAATGNGPRHEALQCVLSGLMMGFAALVRYHAFPASFFLLFVLFAGMKKYRKMTVVSGIAVLAAYLPQVIVNILSGHGPLETYHALNLYNLVYGVNWYHMEDVIPLPPAKNIIFGAPLVFLKHYARWFVELAIFALPPLVYGILEKKENKKIGFCVAGFCGLYAVLFGISASPRAVLFLIPVSLLFFVKIFATPGLSKRTKAIVMWVSLGCACLFLYKDVLRVGLCKNNLETYKKIEAFLIGHGVKNAQETFTCDYDLYFTSLFPFRPLFNGGWGRIATYKYSEYYPELSVASRDRFYNDCIRQKVRYVILDGNAKKLAGFCDSLLCQAIVDPRFSLVFAGDQRKVFLVIKDFSFSKENMNK
jgi:hypothetical protein